MILLLFNKTLCLTVIEMIEESGLTQQDVIRSLKVNECFFPATFKLTSFEAAD
jgi:hypothetical protein